MRHLMISSREYTALWWSSVPGLARNFRCQERLCDLTIVINGNRCFPVHKLILLCASGYFQTLEMNNKLVQNVYYLDDISVCAFEAILEFIYGEKLILSSENVHNILAVATALQFDAAISHCNDYIQSMTRHREIVIRAEASIANEKPSSSSSGIIKKSLASTRITYPSPILTSSFSLHGSDSEAQPTHEDSVNQKLSTAEMEQLKIHNTLLPRPPPLNPQPTICIDLDDDDDKSSLTRLPPPPHATSSTCTTPSSLVVNGDGMIMSMDTTYECHFCKIRFNDLQSKLRHMRQKCHMRQGSKLHKCDHCNFTSQHQHRLRMHRRLIHTHHGVKPYKCAYCPFQASVKSNCRKHIRTHHPGMDGDVIQLFEIPE